MEVLNTAICEPNIRPVDEPKTSPHSHMTNDGYYNQSPKIKRQHSNIPHRPRSACQNPLKIWNLAISTSRIVTIKNNPSSPIPAATINPPRPLLHTNHESRTCALETHIYFLLIPSILRVISNPEIDYLFFVDSKTFDFVYGSKIMEGQVGAYRDEAVWSRIRQVAVPLASWDGLIRVQDEDSIIRAIAKFPNLEEMVLVVGEISDEVMKLGDLEFVKPKEVRRSPVLMGLTMEMFQPWRAFADLFGVEMMEDAVGRYFEGVLRRVVVGEKKQRSGTLA